MDPDSIDKSKPNVSIDYTNQFEKRKFTRPMTAMVGG